MKISTICKLAYLYNKIAGAKPSAGMLFVCPEDNTILLLKRSEDSSSPGTWSLPGGRADDQDSSVLETAKREAEEELNCLPKNKKLAGSHLIERDGKDYKVFIYFINKKEKNKWNSDIKLDKENQKYKWFHIKGLPKNQHLDLSWIKSKIKSLIKEKHTQ